MRPALWYFLFFALLFAGDRAGGFFCQKMTEKSLFRYARLYRGEAQADVLLLGNSRGLAFYQPHLEKITGKSSFNLSYNGLPMYAAKCLTLDYLERSPAPRQMLLDITICDRDNDELLAGLLMYAQQSKHLDTLIRSRLPEVWWGGQLSALFRYNSEVYQRSLAYRNRSDKDWLLDRQISPELRASVSEHRYNLDVHPHLIKLLGETLRAAQAKGTNVTLLIGPYFPGFQVDNLDALKAAVEKETGLNVRDYRNALSDPEDFGDFMHPNKRGSERFLDLLKRDGALDGR